MLGMVCVCFLMLLGLANTVTLVTECLFVLQFRYDGQQSSVHCNLSKVMQTSKKLANSNDLQSKDCHQLCSEHKWDSCN